MALYPSLYQINTRVWLRELAETSGCPATLADIPDAFLDQVAAMGFDYVWFLIQGSEADLELEPHNYGRLETPGGSLVLAYGRAPYFAGWPDTSNSTTAIRASEKPWLRSFSKEAAFQPGASGALKV